MTKTSEMTLIAIILWLGVTFVLGLIYQLQLIGKLITIFK